MIDGDDNGDRQYLNVSGSMETDCGTPLVAVTATQICTSQRGKVYFGSQFWRIQLLGPCS